MIDHDDKAITPTGKSSDCGPIYRYSFTLEDLPRASWYFAVQAVDQAGRLSGYSNEAVKTIE